MLFRILTEDKNRCDIEGIVGAHFAGFTLIPARGYYLGNPERALIIEIETEDRAGVLDASEKIREANSQQEVIVQEIPTYQYVIRESEAESAKTRY